LSHPSVNAEYIFKRDSRALPLRISKASGQEVDVSIHRGLEDLPAGLLSGRKTAVLWDVENVKPWAPLLSIPLQVRRIEVSMGLWL
jgi:hypothetical protein